MKEHTEDYTLDVDLQFTITFFFRIFFFNYVCMCVRNRKLQMQQNVLQSFDSIVSVAV